MAKERRYQAPREYGAWVGGRWYAPRQLLPAGTTEYMIIGTEDLLGGGTGWRTVHALFDVGTSFDEIEAEIGEMFEQLSNKYGIND